MDHGVVLSASTRRFRLCIKLCDKESCNQCPRAGPEIEPAIPVLIRVIKEFSLVPRISTKKSACEILGRLMDHLR
jgi:hypothetical protein